MGRNQPIRTVFRIICAGAGKSRLNSCIQLIIGPLINVKHLVMIHLRRFLGLAVLSLLVFSCQKEYSIENNTGTSTTTSQWEFKEGGVQFKGPIDTATIDTISQFVFLTLSGHSSDGLSQISLQLFDASLKPGSYKTPKSLFTYATGSNIIYQTNQQLADSFTIVITKLDSTGIAGTFSGKAFQGSTAKSIVEGKFSVALKKGNGGSTGSTTSSNDYFPVSTGSYWTYLHANSTADDTVRVTSTGIKKTYDGVSWNLFNNDYGPGGYDTTYYKADSAAGVYNEYFPADVNALGFDPPKAINHIFLKSKVNAGSNWSSSYAGTLGNVALTATVKDTVVQKLSSFTVGSKSFSNVLEVHSGYSVAVGPASQTLYLVRQWFAPGVGLIKYQQVDLINATDVELDILNYKVN